MAERHGDRVVVSKNEARQGIELHRMRYVLAASLALVIAGFGLYYLLAA